MKSNYDILGNHIRLIDTRNRESITDRVLGINIDKFFMPSVASVFALLARNKRIFVFKEIKYMLIMMRNIF